MTTPKVPTRASTDFRNLLNEKFRRVDERLDDLADAIKDQDADREKHFKKLEEAIEELGAVVKKRDRQLKAIGTVAGVVGTFLGLALNWLRVKLRIGDSTP